MANDASSQLSFGGGSAPSSKTNLLSNIVGIAGAVSNPVASIINYFANKSLADDQRKFAVEQWERENAYNAPIAQVQRLKAAGLNPSLMYENGASGLVSASSPDIKMAAPANFQGLDPLSLAQVENLQAQTKSIEDANSRENAKQPFNIQLLHDNVEKVRAEVDTLKQTYTNLIKDGGIKDYQMVSLVQQTEEEAAIFYDRINRFYIETEKAGYERDKAKVELDHLADSLESLINLNWKHADYFKKSGLAAESRASSYADEVTNKLREIEGQLDRWDDMTTNERIEMGVSLFGQILSLGKTLFTTSRVTETITKGPNGTRKQYSRQRSSKN